MKDAAEQLKKKDIITSVVTEFRNVDTYQDLYEPTNGKWIDLTSSFQEEIYRMIVQGKSKRPYYAVLASNLSVVTLDKKPSQSGKTDTDQMVYRMQKKFHRNQLLLKMTR